MWFSRFVLALVVASPVFAVYTSPIQQAVCDSTSGGSCSIANPIVTMNVSATGTGHALVVGSGSGVATNVVISGITCAGCSWVRAKTCAVNRPAEIWYALNVPSGVTTVAITYANFSAYFINISEWAGFPLSGTAVDQTGCGSFPGTTSYTTTLSSSTTNAGDLIINALRINVSTKNSGPSAGWTALTTTTTPQLQAAYYVPASSSAFSNTYGSSTSGTGDGVIVAFFPPSTGGVLSLMGVGK